MKHILLIMLLLPCLSFSMDETEVEDCQTLKDKLSQASAEYNQARADYDKQCG